MAAQDESTKTIMQILRKWSKSTLLDIENDVRNRAFKTGRLWKSLDIKVQHRESKYTTSLKMVYYGQYVDEGTKYIKARNFTKPFKEGAELIPEIEKDYAIFLEKFLAKELNKISSVKKI